MKPYVEFEGKNVAKAIAAACSKLEILEIDLKYDVISEGSTGIFGLVGVKKAKIKVFTETEKKEEKKEEKSNRNEGAVSLVNEAFNENKDAEPASVKTDDDGFDEVEEVEVPEEIAEIGRDALKKIIDLITEDADVITTIDLGRVLYEIKGGNSAVLIGKRGQTLESMQYIVEKIVNKKSEQRIRIQIDIEGYLEQRKESLKNLAEKLADKAKRYGKPMTISQMTAHDRRIVHLTLKEDKGVRTQSVGDGYYRRLIIFPKKSKYKRGSYKKKKY